MISTTERLGKQAVFHRVDGIEKKRGMGAVEHEKRKRVLEEREIHQRDCRDEKRGSGRAGQAKVNARAGERGAIDLEGAWFLGPKNGWGKT